MHTNITLIKAQFLLLKPYNSQSNIWIQQF